MVSRSTPARTRLQAAECRSTCGVVFFPGTALDQAVDAEAGIGPAVAVGEHRGFAWAPCRQLRQQSVGGWEKARRKAKIPRFKSTVDNSLSTQFPGDLPACFHLLHVVSGVRSFLLEPPSCALDGLPQLSCHTYDLIGTGISSGETGASHCSHWIAQCPVIQHLQNKAAETAKQLFQWSFKDSAVRNYKYLARIDQVGVANLVAVRMENPDVQPAKTVPLS